MERYRASTIGGKLPRMLVAVADNGCIINASPTEVEGHRESSMIRRIKLMADYDAFPLWWNDGEHVGDIDPRSLPLSEELLDRLAAWKHRYDQQMNYRDPHASRFFTAQEQHAFEEAGILIWRDVRQELGPSYEISYYSELQGRLISPSHIGS